MQRFTASINSSASVGGAACRRHAVRLGDRLELRTRHLHRLEPDAVVDGTTEEGDA